MERRYKDFSRIPHALIDSGVLALLKPSETKVLLVIHRFADYHTGISWPSIEKINELSGVNKGTVCKAIRELAQKGLIRKHSTGERLRHRNCYVVERNKERLAQLASYIAPAKRIKCKRINRGKNGKFKPIPKNTESSIPNNMDKGIPTNTERYTLPFNTDKKENRETINRDIVLEKDSEALAAKSSQASVTDKNKSIKKANPDIVNQLIKQNGLVWVKKYLRDQGYDEKEIEELKEVKVAEKDDK